MSTALAPPRHPLLIAILRWRLPRLLTELAIARANGRYAKLLASIAKTASWSSTTGGCRSSAPRTAVTCSRSSRTAITEHFLLRFDAYYALHGRDSKGRQDTEDDGDSSALRVEPRVNF